MVLARRSVSLFSVLLMLIAGCATRQPPIKPPYTVYRSPNLVHSPPRRVLLMPIVNTTYDDGFAKQWYDILAGELRSTRKFEVVTTDPHVPCVKRCADLVQRGQYSEPELIAVRDYFRVDGVIFVKQADYYPYTPPRIAASLHLVDATTGETLASIDGNWDADDPCVKELMVEYGRHAVTAERLNDPELVTVAPTYFGKFVAHQLADSMAKLIGLPAALINPTHADSAPSNVVPPDDKSCVSPPEVLPPPDPAKTTIRRHPSLSQIQQTARLGSRHRARASGPRASLSYRRE